jgi:hypothetical protein
MQSREIISEQKWLLYLYLLNCFKELVTLSFQNMYTLLTQGIWTFFIDQFLFFSCFQKISYNADMKSTDSISFTLTIWVYEKAQFKVALRSY